MPVRRLHFVAPTTSADATLVFMGLYEMTDGKLVAIKATSFAVEGVLERSHLQAALREHISLIGDDLMVVAEEFGDFADAKRRIDLLCVDRAARLVVVELKRTDTGGHMELQALRYAAMVSTMTMDDLEKIYSKYLADISDDPDDAGSRLAAWFGDTEGEEPVIQRNVRVVLVSGGFDKEITTTVLWLNDVYQLDIQCIRLTPYRVDGRLLLDVQHVIPLPEAAELTVRLRRREQAAKAVASGKDYTRYVITTSSSVSAPLAKRRAIAAMVSALHEAGVAGEAMAGVLPKAKFLAVDGNLEGDDLVSAFVTEYPGALGNERRWFLEEPLHDSDRTWVLSKMWGLQSEAVLSALVKLAPGAGIAFTSAPG